LQNHGCAACLWDLRNHQQLACFVERNQVTGVAFAPGGKRGVSVSGYTVQSLNLEPPYKAGWSLKQPTLVRVVAFLGERVVTVDGRQLTVCNLEGKIIGERPRPLPHQVNALAASADGKHLATANSNGTVYILRLPPR
jgi:hypothetical protein